MELLLWRWSTAVQVTSLVMIAVFFAVLGRSVRRAEVGWWVKAWVANLAALGVTVGYWVFQPPEPIDPVMRGSYMAAKTAFVVLFLLGAWAHVRPGAPLVGPVHLAAGGQPEAALRAADAAMYEAKPSRPSAQAATGFAS